MLNYVLYVLAELAIMATDLAEIIGSAIAMQLLFGLPLIWGVLITAFDVLIILRWWGSKYTRYYEWLVVTMVMMVALLFFAQVRCFDISIFDLGNHLMNCSAVLYETRFWSCHAWFFTIHPNLHEH
jgi:manganese transport protein